MTPGWYPNDTTHMLWLVSKRHGNGDHERLRPWDPLNSKQDAASAGLGGTQKTQSDDYAPQGLGIP